MKYEVATDNKVDDEFNGHLNFNKLPTVLFRAGCRDDVTASSHQ